MMIKASDYQESKATRDRRTMGSRAGSVPCFLCGRTLAPYGPSTLAIHLTIGDMIVPVEHEIPMNDDQGWFRIGPECAKKLPEGYVI